MTLPEWEDFKSENTEATTEMLKEILMEADTQRTLRVLRGASI